MMNFPTSRVEVCSLQIPVRNLPETFQGIRIVQLSDFHFGDRALPRRVLDDAIAKTQALSPDVICYTGDFVNGDPSKIEELCCRLKTLKPRLGSFAVLGNHDIHYSFSSEQISRALQKIGIRVLRDEIAYLNGEKLAFVGFQFYPEFNPATIIESIPAGTPKLVLMHAPHLAAFLASWPIDLQLSGHTHGGQLILPGLGPLIPRFWTLYEKLPRRVQTGLSKVLPQRIHLTQQYTYMQGLHSLHQGYLYVNRGLGAHFPGRLFCSPEVTVLTLVQSLDTSSTSEEIEAQASDLLEIRT